MWIHFPQTVNSMSINVCWCSYVNRIIIDRRPVVPCTSSSSALELCWYVTRVHLLKFDDRNNFPCRCCAICDVLILRDIQYIFPDSKGDQHIRSCFRGHQECRNCPAARRNRPTLRILALPLVLAFYSNSSIPNCDLWSNHQCFDYREGTAR